MLPTRLPVLLLLALFACTACTERDSAPTDAQLLPLEERQAVAGLTRNYAEFRARQVSDVSYDLRLSLSDVSTTFSGLATIRFNLTAGNQSPLTLDFYSGTVISANINGIPSDFDYERWFITFPADALEPGPNVIEVSYSAPYSKDGAGLHHFTDPENGEIYLYTQFEPYDANRMFPLFDQPDLKASWSLEVVAPQSWRVISNMRESRVEQLQDERHWYFPPGARLSPYVYALHAGPYSMWESQAGDIPLRLFARNALAPYVIPEDWFLFTRQNFDFFQDYFDIPYPFGKYDQVIVPDFNFGAMENVGAVTFSERFISRGEYSRAQRRSLASTIAHEMAHMWFGDLVTMKWWNGLWLNESFASYMSYLALAQATEFEEAWDGFYTGMKLSAYDNDQRVTTHPVEQPVETSAEAFTIIDGITYGKGGAVLKQLNYMLGDEAFRQGIRNYLETHAYSNTELDDFVTALAEAGNTDLTEWQQQWLYTSGVNTIRPSFTCEEGVVTAFTLEQSLPDLEQATQMLRSQSTNVAFYRYSDQQMVPYFSAPVEYSGPSTAVPSAHGESCPEFVFSNQGDYAYVKLRLDDISRETLRTRINAIDDNTVRLMLWQALWEEVIEGYTPATDFVAFTMQALPEETDSLIVSLASGYLANAASYLVRIDPRAYENLLQRIETFTHSQLLSSEAGSELQRIWFSRMVGTARFPAGLERLEALLDGELALEGLSIDQDRRWSLLTTLNRYAWENYAERLEAEAQIDQSDSGNNSYLAALAIRPDEAVKQGWVSTIISEPDSYRPAAMRNVMSALFPDEQGDYLRFHQGTLIAALAELIARDDHVYLSNYMDSFALGTCDEASDTLLSEAIELYSGQNLYVEQGLMNDRHRNRQCLNVRAALEAEQ